MLVTNMHVMAGKGANGAIQNPSGNEEMYQGLGNLRDKVGSNLVWEPVSFTGSNYVDAAMCELEDDVEAEFTLHDVPEHSDRKVIAGAMEPKKNMELTVLSASTGEKTAAVTHTNQEDDFGGVEFDGLIRLRCNRPLVDGDSGSPCLYKVREGVYKMVGVLFAMDALYPRTGWAFPASAAERELGITFGKRAPIASASASPSSPTLGATVTLDGSGSRDPEGNSLAYCWEQTPGVGGGQVELKNADEAVATFTMPSGPAALTFKLTVTDSLGQTGADTAIVTANRPPTANAGRDQTVEARARVNLRGSGADPDRADALT